jgi:hypothetical protein
MPRYTNPSLFKPAPKRKPKKVVKNPKVERTRNGGTWTEAEFFGRLRAMLRGMTRYWKPITEKRKSVKVGTGRNAKYYCEGCKTLHDKVEINHIHAAGSLRSYADLPGFCERLFIEGTDGLEALCKSCHHTKTHSSKL